MRGTTRPGRFLPALGWRLPIAALGGLAVAILLVLVSLQVAVPRLTITPSTSSAGAFGMGIAPFFLFGLATLVGTGLGAGVVAVLVRDALAGHPPRLVDAWHDAWRALPRVVLLAPLFAVSLLITVRWWQWVELVVVLGLLLALAVPATRPAVRRHAWLAVPLAPALAVLVLAAVVVTSVLGRHLVLPVVRHAWSTPWPSRVRVVAALGVLALAGWGLGTLAASVQSSSLPLGTVIALLLAITAVVEVMVGLVLAAIAHIAGPTPLPRPPAGGPARASYGGRWFWTRRRVARTAMLTVVAVGMQTYGLGGWASADDATDPTSPPSESTSAVDTPVEPESTPSAESTPAPDPVTDQTTDQPISRDPSSEPPADEPTDQPPDQPAGDTPPDENPDQPSQGPSSFPLVVTTLDDDRAYPATECTTPSAPCSLRAAVATVSDRMANAGGLDVSGRIRFDVDGTIRLAGSLELPDGVRLDASAHDVVIDAHHDSRALRVVATTPAASGVDLAHLTVIGGRSDGPGAALLADPGVTVTLTEVVLRDNISGVVGVSSGTDGGAVSSPGEVRIHHSAFVDNHARSGRGGAIGAAELTVSDSTFVANTGTGATGGSLWASGTAYLRHLTVVGGGGVAGSGAPVDLTNSIVDVADAGPALACSDVATPTVDGGLTGNLDPTGSCHGTTGHLTNATDPGGIGSANRPTPVIELFPGSNAIGLGEPASCTSDDQHGTPRPYGERCDGGAFQTTSTPAPVTVSVSLTSRRNPSSYGDPVVVDVQITSSAPLPTGTVEVRDGTRVVGTAPSLDADGAAAITLADLAPGRRQLVAAYVGSGGGDLATSTPLVQVVKVETTLAVTAPAPVRLHDTVRVTATLGSPAGSDPADATGTITFTTFDAARQPVLDVRPIIGGTASLDIASLASSSVTASYSGDDLFFFTLTDQQITTADLPTTTTATVLRAEHGAPFVVQADVADAVGPVGFASLRLLEGDRLLDDGFAFRGRGTLSATALPLGAHTLTIETVPDTGWARSTTTFTAHVVASGTSVTLDPVQPITYGQQAQVFARFTGAGTSEVRLVDGDTVLESRTVELPGYAAFAVPLDVGSHALRVEIVGSQTAAPSRSATTTVVVPRVPVTLMLGSRSVAELGQASTLEVFGNGTGRLVVTAAGTVIGGGTLAEGRGTVTFTPRAAGTTGLLVELDPDPRYEPASVATSVDVPRTTAPRPSLSWNDAPSVGRATLTVSFDAPVTGTVSLVDTQSGTTVGTLGSAPLVDRTATVAFTGRAGACFCDGRLRLDYTGDARFAPRSYDAVPDVRLPLQTTTTTLATLPATIAHEDPIRLEASVVSPTDPDPQGTVVFSVDGVEQTPVAVVAGRAGLTLAQQGTGRHDLGARFVPGETSGLAASSATAASVTVAYPRVPDVALSTFGIPRAGDSLVVRVTAGPSRDSSALRPGAVVRLTDASGTVLGTGTWPSDPAARTLDISATTPHAGEVLVQARFTYGPDGRDGVSAVLPLTVAQQPLVLQLRPVTSEPRVGRPLVLRASLDALPAGLRSTPLTLTLTGPAGGTLPLRPLGVGEDHVDIELTPTTAGWLTYRVSTPGDGADLAAGSTEVRVSVFRTSATVTLAPEPGAAPVNIQARWRPQVSVSATEPAAGLPAPTGSVQITAQGATLTCSIAALGTAACELPAGALGVPATSVSLFYLGDALYDPSFTSASVETFYPGTTITADVSPTPERWVVGTPATATWSVTAFNGGPVAGTVTVTLGDGLQRLTLCSAEVGLGTCTFTVPDRGPLRAWSSELLITTFVPSRPDLAGSQTGRIVSAAAHCLPAATIATSYGATSSLAPPRVAAPTLSGTRCTVAGISGFVEGQPVTADFSAALADPALAQYTMDHWDNGQRGPFGEFGQIGGATPTLTLPASPGLLLRAVLRWAPTCVTIRVGTERDAPTNSSLTPGVVYGTVRNLTVPTCGDPLGSPYDRQLLERGQARYAVGTKVQLEVTPSVGRRVLDVVGATVDNPTFAPGMPVTASLSATADALVYPRFRDVDGCTPVETGAGPGGSLTVVSGTLPTRAQQARLNRAYDIFEDPNGTCRTATGAAGFLAGTSVTLQATPRNNGSAQPPPLADQYFFLGRWFNAFTGDPATLLAATNQGTLPPASSYAPATQVVTIPNPEITYGVSRGVLRFGASFAHISCAPVALVLDRPVKPGIDPRLRLSEASACPARSDTNVTSTKAVVEGGDAPGPGTVERRTDSRVTWALVGTEAVVRPDPPVVKLPYGDSRTAILETRDQSGRLAGTTATDATARLGVVRADGRYVVSGRYQSGGCVVPDVTVKPSWLSYKVVSTNCPAGMVDPKNWANARLSAISQPGLVPVWKSEETMTGLYDPLGTANASTTWALPANQVNWSTWSGNGGAVPKITLRYCAPLPVSSALVPPGGTRAITSYTTYGSGSDALARVTRTAPPTAGVIKDDDAGCPGLSALPGTSPKLSIAGGAEDLFSLGGTRPQGSTGAFTGTLSTLRVQANGVVAGIPEVAVSLRCFNLRTGDRVDVALPTNCPTVGGGTSGYTKGTVLPLSFDGSSKVEFEHWNGVDSPKPSEEQGPDAVVIMSGDRDVSAEYDSLSVWEQAGNFFSNLGQRIVGGLITFGLNLLTGAYAIVQFSALISQGISAGLSYVGVPASVTSVFDNYSESVENVGTVINSLSDCTNTWASGGKSSVLSLPKGGTTGAVLGGVNDHGETALELVGAEGAAGKAGTVTTGLAIGTLLTTGIESWTSPANWSGVTDIGSCLKDTIGDAADKQAEMFGVTTTRKP